MYEYRCIIKRVVDGDTVDVDIDLGFHVVLKNQRVRLRGIDTPESRTRDKVEKKFGIAAKKYLELMLGHGDATLVTHKDGKGKFGRILGDFMVYDSKADARRSVNTMMVEQHFAVPYFGNSKEDIEALHLLNRVLLAEHWLEGIVVK